MLSGFYMVLGTKQVFNKCRCAGKVHEVALGQKGGCGQWFSGTYG